MRNENIALLPSFVNREFQPWNVKSISQLTMPQTYVELCHQIDSTCYRGYSFDVYCFIFWCISSKNTTYYHLGCFPFFLLMLFSSSMKCDLILFMFGSYDDHFHPNGIDFGSCLQCWWRLYSHISGDFARGHIDLSNCYIHRQTSTLQFHLSNQIVASILF